MTTQQIFYWAYTAPINPSGASPKLTKEQVLAGLNRKVRHAEEFVPGAILQTEVLDETRNEHGHEVVEREVVFKEGNRKVKETVTAFGDLKHEFIQPDGSKVNNIVSQGADGELFMTFTFEWVLNETDEKVIEEKKAGWRAMSSKAVTGTIDVTRQMAKDGKI